ncbi:MAG: hypothetical protein HFE63_00215 [Clostridiales bacterium]|nr:hypothetical protein [Clostridiales bacterium]
MTSKKIKCMVLVFVLIFMQVIGAIAVNADYIGLPKIINPGLDLSMNNPQVAKKVLSNAGSLGAGKITYSGPFYWYCLNEDGSLRLNQANYNIRHEDGRTGVVTVYEFEGNIVSAFRYNPDGNSPWFIDENYIAIGNDDGTFIVTYDNIYQFMPLTCVANYTDNPIKKAKVKTTAERCGNILLQSSKAMTAQFTKSEMMNSASSTEVGIDVPIVPQIVNGDSYNGAVCWFACMASIVRTREPITYSELTALEVQNASMKIDTKYGRLASIDDLEYLLQTLYLDEKYHTTRSFHANCKMSQNSYKSIIDNECILLAYFGDEDKNVHAVVLSKYKYEDGNLKAICMDPLDSGDIVSLGWIDGKLSLPFGSNYLIYRENVTSYK